ncbi:MAG TPA: cytochrome c oxidase assembly protein, partial [Gammaproteobacteria bacterium]|nr:cytochrome c oxidase assembly protein [Gammaproteobacteria bacterium]
ITGQAIYSVMPIEAAMYFKKTDCFCFKQQLLKSGEEKDMPVVFVVDQGLPANINNIVLSYTFLRADKYASKEETVTK